PWRGEPLELVRGGGAHVRELLLLGDVDVHVIGPGVLAHDHALVHLFRGLHEEAHPLLKGHHGEGRRDAGTVGHDRARGASDDLPRPVVVSVGDRVGDPGAPGRRHELGPEPDETPRGDDELHAHPAGAVVGHSLHAAFAAGEKLRDRAEVLLRRIDREMLERLLDLAVLSLASDHLRLAHGELEALPPHVLDEDRQCQLSAPLHLPGVGTADVYDLQRHVSDELTVQAVLHHAGGELVPLDLADQRRGVRADRHRDRRVVDGDGRERTHVLGIGDRLADRDLLDPRDRHDVAGRRALCGVALQRPGLQQLRDPGVGVGAVVAYPGDRLPLLERAVEDTQEREPPEERTGVEVG
ncbi:hypothetical protein ABE10_00905, partial [Bacillus toyonensis]|nr:hypothetical protein [Bacillus toyonensis]